MRDIVGVILGIIVSLAVVAGVRLLAVTLHALPGMAINDPVVMAAWLQGAPLHVLILYAAAWFFGAFAGGWVALRVARWAGALWIVTGVALVLSAASILQLSYPLWVKVVLIAGPLLGGWLATRLAPGDAVDSIDG